MIETVIRHKGNIREDTIFGEVKRKCGQIAEGSSQHLVHNESWTPNMGI